MPIRFGRLGVCHLLLLAMAAQPCRAEVTFDLAGARLTLDDRGSVASLVFADGTAWPQTGQPAFSLETDAGTRLAQSVRLAGDRLRVAFEGGSVAEFTVARQPGFVVLRLAKLEADAPVDRLGLFRLALPEGAQVGGSLNSAWAGPWVAAVMAAQPNVHAWSEHSGAARGDRAGCKHEFVQTDQAKVGRAAARFAATCNQPPGVWLQVA
ncbi:MAG: hypothetical protein NUV77_17655, partial [Thermoguttaceae bacterium]|nr:hypothetical protein [Thermoguttaceae bacterium]